MPLVYSSIDSSNLALPSSNFDTILTLSFVVKTSLLKVILKLFRQVFVSQALTVLFLFSFSIFEHFFFQGKTHFLPTRLKVSESQIKKNIFLELIFEQKSTPSMDLSSKYTEVTQHTTLQPQTVCRQTVYDTLNSLSLKWILKLVAI